MHFGIMTIIIRKNDFMDGPSHFEYTLRQQLKMEMHWRLYNCVCWPIADCSFIQKVIEGSSNTQFH